MIAHKHSDSTHRLDGVQKWFDRQFHVGSKHLHVLYKSPELSFEMKQKHSGAPNLSIGFETSEDKCYIVARRDNKPDCIVRIQPGKLRNERQLRTHLGERNVGCRTEIRLLRDLAAKLRGEHKQKVTWAKLPL